jgi:PAS domain S-box-containing protein
MPRENTTTKGLDVAPAGTPIRFAILYLAAALAWLFVTDWVAIRFFSDSPTAQTVKGTAFMAMSALIVWALVHHSARSLRRQNESLRRQVAFNRGIVESSPLPIIVLDSDANVVLWSPAAHTVFGWTSTDVMGEPLPCFEPGHVTWDDRLWSRIRAGESIAALECGATDERGHNVVVSLSVAPLDGSDGEFIGAIVMMQDVSEQKAALERVRSSEKRLRLLFEANPRPMWVYDRETYGFVQVNHAAVEHYGYSAEEFRSMTIFDIRPVEERARLDENLRSDRPPLERSESWIHHTKDGRGIEVDIDSHEVHLDGKAHVLVVANDVTERNRLGRQNERIAHELRTMTARLLQAQEAERRHIARELHDESGAMLTALQLCLKMANEKVRPDNDPARNELNEAALIATELGEKMRQLSTSLMPGVLDDLGLIAGLEWLIDRFSRQTGIQVGLFHDIPEGHRLPSDIETIAYRVIQEALTNIARHAGVDTATVSINRSDSEVALHVIDEGRGFDAAEASAKGHLGLHSMRERCSLVDGHLTISSAPGEGTRVSAVIPVSQS